MARWVVLGVIEEYPDEPDRLTAEGRAAARYGDRVHRVMSRPEYEEMRIEAALRAKRRRPRDGDG